MYVLRVVYLSSICKIKLVSQLPYSGLRSYGIDIFTSKRAPVFKVKGSPNTHTGLRQFDYFLRHVSDGLIIVWLGQAPIQNIQGDR